MQIKSFPLPHARGSRNLRVLVDTDEHQRFPLELLTEAVTEGEADETETARHQTRATFPQKVRRVQMLPDSWPYKNDALQRLLQTDEDVNEEGESDEDE